MRNSIRMLAIAAGLAAAGCPGDFRHPLAPPDEGFIEQELTGRWTCVSADDPAPASLTIVAFDGHQYYLELLEQGKREPDRYRGHATRFEARRFLNVQEIGGDTDTWSLTEYRILGGNTLRMRYVDPGAFEDVIDEPERVRERLASRLDDPEIVVDLLSCTRSEAR